MSTASPADFRKQAAVRSRGETPLHAIGLALSAAPALLLVASAAGLLYGGFSLSLDSIDGWRFIVLGAMGVTLLLLGVHLRITTGAWSREVIVLLSFCVLVSALLLAIPEYTYGYYINGIIHRSFFTAVLVLPLSTWTSSTALAYVLGGGPTARDRSRLIFVALPLAFASLAYGAIVFRVVEKGFGDLGWNQVSRAYSADILKTGANTATLVSHAGLQNYILGTLLLILLTGIISLPIGVGTGVFLSEYGGRPGQLVSISVYMLRSISVFILAITALSLVTYANDHYTLDNLFGRWIQGYYTSNGFKQPGNGSFLLAAVFLSMLIIPVITRATEEGCRSLPVDIKEGSMSLGATEGHTLTRILVPWALPNIVTGLILGLAEASGSVTILLFIAGTGQEGVGPLRPVTSLAFLLYYAHPGRGPNSFTSVMSHFEFPAALLLLMITFTLTILALILRQRFAKRYRSGISYV